MIDEDIDFAADAPKITHEKLSRVSKLAIEMLKTRSEIADFELTLENKKKFLLTLQTVELPEAMAEAGLTQFKTTSGAIIEVKDIVAGSMAKERKDDCLDWLEVHNHDGIIKNEVSVSVSFPKGNKGNAEALFKALMELELLKAVNVEPTNKPDVHYQTFNKWLRETHEEHQENHLSGEESIDIDCPFCDRDAETLLGIFVGKKAEVKEEKSKKACF